MVRKLTGMGEEVRRHHVRISCLAMLKHVRPQCVTGG